MSLKANYEDQYILLGILINLIIIFIAVHLLKWLEKILGKAGLIAVRKFFGVILLAIAVKIFGTNIQAFAKIIFSYRLHNSNCITAVPVPTRSEATELGITPLCNIFSWHQLVNYFRAEKFRSRSTMDSIRASEAFDSGSIPDETTTNVASAYNGFKSTCKKIREV